MKNIEPLDFNADCRLWVRHADLQIILGFDDPKSLDKWRVKLGKRFEHNERRGPHRGVWFHLPSWLRAYEAARNPASTTADSTATESTDRQRFYKAQADREELAFERERRELDANWVHTDDAIADYIAVGDVLRMNSERMCPTCKQVLVDGLINVERKFCHENRSPTGHRVVGGARQAANPSKPS